MTFDPAGKSIDEILDYGAAGLRYWELVMPRYDEAFTPLPNSASSTLRAAYDEQRGADLAGLDDARSRLVVALAAAETQWSAQWGLAHQLPADWQGGTGAAAQSILVAQLRRAREDLDAAQSAATALGDLLTPLRQAAAAKAEAALALLESAPDGAPRVAVAGRTPDEIATLDANDPWLATTFKSEVEHNLDAFTRACRTADHAFESQYATVISALDGIADLPYPQPGGLENEQPSGCTDSGQFGHAPVPAGTARDVPTDGCCTPDGAPNAGGQPTSPESIDPRSGSGSAPNTNPDQRSIPAAYAGQDPGSTTGLPNDCDRSSGGPSTAPATTCPDSGKPNPSQPQCVPSTAPATCDHPSTRTTPSTTHRDTEADSPQSPPGSATEPDRSSPAEPLAEAATAFLTTLTGFADSLFTTLIPETLSALTDLLPTSGESTPESANPDPNPLTPADVTPDPAEPSKGAPNPSLPEPPPDSADSQPPAAGNQPPDGSANSPDSCENPPLQPEKAGATADPAHPAPPPPIAPDAESPAAPPIARDGDPAQRPCPPGIDQAPQLDGKAPPEPPPTPPGNQSTCEPKPLPPNEPAPDPNPVPEVPAPQPGCEAAPLPPKAAAPNDPPDSPPQPNLDVRPLGPDGQPPPAASPPTEAAPPQPPERPGDGPPGSEIPDIGTDIPDTVQP
ncbi:hypothetical protein ACWDOP_04215 [Nocardia sp. NPDC003693]